MSTGVGGQVAQKRMPHSFEIGCAGGAASAVAQPDSAAHPCIL